VKDPSDLLDFMKNVLLVVRLAFRVWSCKDDTTWMTDHRSSCYGARNSVRQGTSEARTTRHGPLSERNRADT
jgi:hypothetical protein